MRKESVALEAGRPQAAEVTAELRPGPALVGMRAAAEAPGLAEVPAPAEAGAPAQDHCRRWLGRRRACA